MAINFKFMNKSEILTFNFETFKRIYQFAFGACNDEFLNKKYNEYMEELENNRHAAMLWWGQLEKDQKSYYMVHYYDKIRPWALTEHFGIVNPDNISGREIEILFNNKK